MSTFYVNEGLSQEKENHCLLGGHCPSGGWGQDMKASFWHEGNSCERGPGQRQGECTGERWPGAERNREELELKDWKGGCCEGRK